MFVIKSCQKIEYNALFMMIFIPVSNFGDHPLGDTNITLTRRKLMRDGKCIKTKIIQINKIYLFHLYKYEHEFT